MMIIAWMAAGICSTLAMDVFGGIVRKTGFTAGAPPQLIGRFFWTAFHGQFTVDKEAVTPLTPAAIAAVLLVHYAIGMTLAVAFGFFCRQFGVSTPAWWVSIAFGTATTLLPSLWMFPALGFGVFGLNGPAELLLFRTALVNHVLFGVGLALAVRFVVPRFG